MSIKRRYDIPPQEQQIIAGQGAKIGGKQTGLR
jgi:hypothetical protein